MTTAPPHTGTPSEIGAGSPPPTGPTLTRGPEADLRPDWWRDQRAPAPGERPAIRIDPTPFRGRRGWRLFASQWLPRPIASLFPFFADAGNLERITPETVRFKILSPMPVDMKPGALIDYQLTIRAVPVKWRTEITVWEPGLDDAAEPGGKRWRFVDEQRRGPYVYWVHEHRFAPDERDGVMGTRCDDTVHYGVPGGPLAPLANALLVQRDIAKIFAFRVDRMNEMFGRPEAEADHGG